MLTIRHYDVTVESFRIESFNLTGGKNGWRYDSIFIEIFLTNIHTY